MKKNLLTSLSLALAFTLSLPVAAQVGKGGLTEQDLSTIRSGFDQSPANRALLNAIQANGMVLTSAAPKDYPTGEFSNRVASRGIADQKQSGRCWLFTGLNVLRAELMQKNNAGEFFFSHNYSFFWDQLEKSNLFLQGIIDTRKKPIDDRTVAWLFRNPIGDGGQFTGVSDNLTKYGVVPSEVMPETTNSNNTSRLSSLIAKVLRQGGIRLRQAAEKGASEKQLEQQKLTILKSVYRLLVLNLGEPPTKFTYTLRDAQGKAISTKEYTPKSFYQEFIGRDLRNEYVMIMNDPSRPYYKTYQIEYDRHMYDGKNWTYVNVPIEELKTMAIASIKDSTMLYYSCDVGKELDSKRGVLSMGYNDYEAILGYPIDMTKKERIETGDSGSTHAMTLVAVDLNAAGKPTKWMVENSWGATSGHQGHLIMTDEWFDAYTFRIVVDKKYLTDKVRAVMNDKPTMLPPWDPMFRTEE